MNLNALKGKLRENGKTYQDAAKKLGISTATFNTKINGRSQFNCDEAIILSKFLNLTRDEQSRIFFGQ